MPEFGGIHRYTNPQNFANSITNLSIIIPGKEFVVIHADTKHEILAVIGPQQ